MTTAVQLNNHPATIAAEGRRKKSEAAKGNNNAAKDRAKTVTDHNDPPLKQDKHPAREARAAEAHVSSSTMARAEFIANTTSQGGRA